MSKDVDVLLIDLRGRRHCNRIVKIRELPPSEVEALDRSAANQAKSHPEGVVAFQSIRAKEGIQRMVVAVSDVLPDDSSDVLQAAEKATWRECSFDKFQTNDAFDFDALFKSKDVVTLARIFSDFHDVSLSEIEGIVGKAVSQSTTI